MLRFTHVMTWFLSHVRKPTYKCSTVIERGEWGGRIEREKEKNAIYSIECVDTM